MDMDATTDTLADIEDGHTVVETCADDGRLLSTATLGPDGALDGPFTAYGPDGAVQMRMTYRAGVAEGSATVFLNGKPQTEMTYAGGLLEGEMRSFDAGGRLVSVVRYAGGRRHGLMECFGPDGKPLMTAAYKDDRLDGPMVEYRADGTVRRSASYRNDLLDGEVVEFHPGGSPSERTVFAAGVPVEGPQRFDDPDAPGKKGLLARLRGK